MAPNWENQTIWTGDNLEIMRGMNSESVDLIYLDPPFSKNRTYAAPIGSKAAGAAFQDTWSLDEVNLAWHGEIKHDYPGLYALLQATREVHSDAMMSYLISMAVRLMEMHRLLKPTGSLYLHCDQTAGHYLKTLLDCIFAPGQAQQSDRPHGGAPGVAPGGRSGRQGDGRDLPRLDWKDHGRRAHEGPHQGDLRYLISRNEPAKKGERRSLSRCAAPRCSIPNEG